MSEINKIMKARLNLTIDQQLLEQIKGYATKKKVSISELVEDYFKHIAKPKSERNILDMVEQLPNPKIDVSGDLKKEYFKNKGKNHGL